MYSRTVLLALSALGFCTAANADLYDVTLEEYGAGKRQRVAANGQLAWDENSGTETFYNVRANEHVWLEAGSDTRIYTHCVEIYQSVVLGDSYLFESTGIENVPQRNSWPGEMGAIRAELVSDLYANYANPLTGQVVAGGIPSATIDDYGAAFQLMLWEITHENFSADSAAGMAEQISFDMGAIQSQADASVNLVLQDMIDILNDGVIDIVALEGWTNETAQDQSRMVIPGAGTLFGLGMLTPLTRRRRRNS